MVEKQRREMTLDEWCEQLPASHLVNKQLKELKEKAEKPGRGTGQLEKPG